VQQHGSPRLASLAVRCMPALPQLALQPQHKHKLLLQSLSLLPPAPHDTDQSRKRYPLPMPYATSTAYPPPAGERAPTSLAGPSPASRSSSRLQPPPPPRRSSRGAVPRRVARGLHVGLQRGAARHVPIGVLGGRRVRLGVVQLLHDLRTRAGGPRCGEAAVCWCAAAEAGKACALGAVCGAQPQPSVLHGLRRSITTWRGSRSYRARRRRLVREARAPLCCAAAAPPAWWGWRPSRRPRCARPAGQGAAAARGGGCRMP
jgi:hypothetical protein